MDNSSSFIPLKARHRRKRRSATSTPPAALSVVDVQIVSEDPNDLLLMVTFNTTEAQPLVDAVGFFPGKWHARRGGMRYNGGNVQLVDYHRLEVALQSNDPEAGADGLWYSNAPSDVADTLGRELAAFAGLPL